MLDALILSDLHLGSTNCQAKLLCEFLEHLKEGRLATQELIMACVRRRKDSHKTSANPCYQNVNDR
ncbi:MAG TPA: hypothetical protein VKU02_00960 [Gemmataceae bacterium]|nr:hypothetical protein [Gemmataceae bacterium]